MRVVDHPVPSYSADELLIRIVGASLCGSDLVPYNGWHVKNSIEGLVGGHEAVGIVAAGE